MDSIVINAKALEYKERTLRITPQLIQELGINKAGVYLNLDEFIVSCMPFDLSLTSARLLSFLSSQELTFFESMKGRPQKLNLSFTPKYSSKPISFFVVCEIISFMKPDPKSPYCFIDLKFKQTPLDLKEILVTYFLDYDAAEKLYANATEIVCDKEQIPLILGAKHADLMHQGLEAKHLKILSLSPKNVRVFGEFDGQSPKIGDALDLESPTGDKACILHGTCKEFTAFSDVEGFAYLTIELKFNSYLIAKIAKAVARKPK